MDSPVIFDYARVKKHRVRAAQNFPAHDFLFKEASSRLAECLDDIAKPFLSALDLSSHILMENQLKERGIQHAVRMDKAHPLFCNPSKDIAASLHWHDDKKDIDVEFLPFAENTFDLVISAGGLHWVNDLPGVLSQIQRALKPDGCFLAIMPGGETLKELRISLEQAELAMRGGISPRISPFIDVRNAGSLLQRACFALPVVDSDIITIEYDHPLKLLHDLRGMGETNALISSAKQFTSRCVMMAAMEYYQRHFSNEAGRVLATVELVTLTGWKPHESQQQPARRGSGKVNLGDVLT